MNIPFYKSLNLQFFAEEGGGAGGGGSETKDLITKLSNDVTKASTELKGLMDQQADEIRKHGETSNQTATKVKAAEDRMLKLEGDIKGFTEELNEIKKKGGRPDYSGGERKSIGEQFITSDQFKNTIAAGHKSTPAFDIKSFFSKKDIDSADANGGLLAGTYRYPEIVAAPNEQLRLRDLMNVQPIGSPSVEYIEESGFINAAATVAEKVAAPQSDITFEQKTAAVRTISHFIPATQNILDDAPMLRNYIDNRLTYGLKMTEEAQILYGSGANEDLLGLMVHAGTQNVGERPDADTTRIDHIRRAITRARLAGYPISAIVLHPTDWEAIELSKGTDGHYIFTSVNEGGQMRLFRTPVVESTGMNEGEFLTGALGMAAQLLDREQSAVRVSDSHADYFTRRMLAIMASERLAMPIYRPEALVKGSFTVTGAV
jgi:HK97 family phage major capsid protein